MASLSDVFDIICTDCSMVLRKERIDYCESICSYN